MSEQNNVCLLISIDECEGIQAQAFTDPEDAYKAMEYSYNNAIRGLKDDEEEYDKEASFLDKECANISLYDSSIQWIIVKAFVQTPEMAAVIRQYDQMVLEADNLDSAQCIKKFKCPVSDADINAWYSKDKRVLLYTAYHTPYAEEKECIPYEAYKWCVERGIQEVSGIKEANRIVAAIEANALFDQKP